MKKIYSLILILISTISMNIQSYSAEMAVKHNTDISVETDNIVVNNMTNNSLQFYVPEINSDNKWYIMDRILYKYFPEAYFQDWYYQYDQNNIRLVDVYVSSDKTKYYLNFSNEFYNKTVANDNSEYEDFVLYLISSAGINDYINQDEVIRKIVNVLKQYTYDDSTYTNLLLSGIPGYKIVRDYGITMCHSDSKLFKACMDRLGIPCRIIENDSHGWNEVYINDTWVGVDISYERKTSKPGSYIYFNDNNRSKIQIFE